MELDYRLDAVGSPIKIGSRVAFSRPRSSHDGVRMVAGTVVRLLPKSVEVEYEIEADIRWRKPLVIKKLEHVVLIPKFEPVDTMEKWDKKYGTR